MGDVTLGLQGAIVARLKGDANLSALIGGRVFDRAEADAVFPYVTVGEDQALADDGDGYDGALVYLTLHAWSRAVGLPEVKRVASAVRDVLHRAGDFSVEGHRILEIRCTDRRFLRDPDGVTSHAVLTFEALTEPE